MYTIRTYVITVCQGSVRIRKHFTSKYELFLYHGYLNLKIKSFINYTMLQYILSKTNLHPFHMKIREIYIKWGKHDLTFPLRSKKKFDRHLLLWPLPLNQATRSLSKSNIQFVLQNEQFQNLFVFILISFIENSQLP